MVLAHIARPLTPACMLCAASHDPWRHAAYMACMLTVQSSVNEIGITNVARSYLRVYAISGDKNAGEWCIPLASRDPARLVSY